MRRGDERGSYQRTVGDVPGGEWGRGSGGGFRAEWEGPEGVECRRGHVTQWYDSRGWRGGRVASNGGAR